MRILYCWLILRYEAAFVFGSLGSPFFNLMDCFLYFISWICTPTFAPQMFLRSVVPSVFLTQIKGLILSPSPATFLSPTWCNKILPLYPKHLSWLGGHCTLLPYSFDSFYFFHAPSPSPFAGSPEKLVSPWSWSTVGTLLEESTLRVPSFNLIFTSQSWDISSFSSFSFCSPLPYPIHLLKTHSDLTLSCPLQCVPNHTPYNVVGILACECSLFSLISFLLPCTLGETYLSPVPSLNSLHRGVSCSFSSLFVCLLASSVVLRASRATPGNVWEAMWCRESNQSKITIQVAFL